MKINKLAVGVICVLAIVVTFLCTYVFEKLDGYKKEIQRLHTYHSAVIKRHDEDIGILFMRLNRLEAIQQDMSETVDKLDYLSTHSY